MVRHWDRASGKQIQHWLLPLHKERRRILAVNVAADRVVAYRRDDVLEVISLRLGTILFSVKDPGVDTAALSPDGHVLAVWHNDLDTVTIWDVDKHLKQRTLSALPGRKEAQAFAMARLLFSPNGRLLALRVGRYDAKLDYVSTAHVWEVGAGKELLRETIKGWQEDVAFSPDSATFAWSGPKAITLRDVHRKRRERLLKLDLGASPDVARYLAFSSNGRHLAAASGGKLIVYDLARNQAREFTACVQETACLAFSPNGKELIGAGVTSLFRWDTATGKLRPSLVDAARPTHHMVFAAPDRLYTVATNRFTVWDARSGRKLRRHSLNNAEHLRITGDATRFAVLQDSNKVVCRDVASGRVLQTHSFDKEVIFFDFLGDEQGMFIATKNDQVHYRIAGQKDRTLPLSFKGAAERGKAFSSQGRLAANAKWGGVVFPSSVWQNTLHIPVVETATGHALPIMALPAPPKDGLDPMAAMFAPMSGPWRWAPF